MALKKRDQALWSRRATNAVIFLAWCSLSGLKNVLSSAIHEFDRLRDSALLSFQPPSPDGNALQPCHAVQEGGLLATEMLRGERPFPENHRCPSHEDGGRGLRFRPGTLRMSSAESLRHCFINATLFEAHMVPYKGAGDKLVAISDGYGFGYVLVAKSGSSTSRHYMQDYFNGTVMRTPFRVLMGNYLELISFVRDPLSRFYSSFDEAYMRKKPWDREGELDDRYTHMYNNMTKDKYNTCAKGDARTRYRNRALCKEVDSDMLRHFETFVECYDGLEPFDIHLKLQTMHFTDGGGNILPMSVLYDASEVEAGWTDVANRFGAAAFMNKTDDALRARDGGRRTFNISLVSPSVKRKICSLMALDYCCLNIELPDECRGIGGDQEDSAFCTIQRDEANETRIYHGTDLDLNTTE